MNRLAWNEDGSRLASVSDDRTVRVWEYGGGSTDSEAARHDAVATGHQSNIFGVRFLPATGDRFIATGAMDALVQLHDREAGTSETYGYHDGRVKEVETEPGNPHLFFSASEDGTVRQFDRRIPRDRQGEDASNVLVDCGGHGLEVKSLAVNPVRPLELAVGTSGLEVLLFDRRRLSLGKRGSATASSRCQTYAPPVLGHGGGRSRHATHVAFSSTGEKLLANFHGDHAYVFDVRRPGGRATPLDPGAASSGDADKEVEAYWLARAAAADREGGAIYPGSRGNLKIEAALTEGIRALPHSVKLLLTRGHFLFNRRWHGDLLAALSDAESVLDCSAEGCFAFAAELLVAKVYVALYRAEDRNGCGEWTTDGSIEYSSAFPKTDFLRAAEMGLRNLATFGPGPDVSGQQREEIWWHHPAGDPPNDRRGTPGANWQDGPWRRNGLGFWQPASPPTEVEKELLEVRALLEEEEEKRRIAEKPKKSRATHGVPGGSSAPRAGDPRGSGGDQPRDEPRAVREGGLQQLLIPGTEHADDEGVHIRVHESYESESESDEEGSADDGSSSSDDEYSSESDDGESILEQLRRDPPGDCGDISAVGGDDLVLRAYSARILCPGEALRRSRWWSETRPHRQRYVGAANLQTDIKEANFLGANDEVVACGSDDGFCYLFEAATGKLLKVLRADEDVVNCVAPHPTRCTLATSGIEDTVRIWSPHGSHYTRHSAAASTDCPDMMEAYASQNQQEMSRPRVFLRGLPRELLQGLMAREGLMARSLGENPDLAGAMNNLEQHLQARAAAEFPLPGAGEGGGDPEGEDAGCYIS